MIFGSVTHDKKNVDKVCAWMSLNNLIQDKFQSKLSIIAWVHSKIEGDEINSYDLHSQNTWSSVFPDMLGLVIQLNEDGTKVATFDFYALTMKGKRKLSQCEKPQNELHHECNNKALYKSCMDYVRFTDIPVEVIYDVFEVTIDDPLEMTADDIQTQTDDDMMEVDEDDFCWQICKGCKKAFDDSSKFCMHVSRAKCKESYGNELTIWIEERKKNSNRKKTKKYKKNHPEKVRQFKKTYNTKHRDVIISKQKEYNLKMKNQEFGKRFMKFKEATIDGAAYVCNCCRRLLFKTGIVFE